MSGEAPDHKSPKQLLIVEDETDIREVLGELLRMEGYGVFEAGNGREALDRLDSLPRPCLILLDLLMPVMGGIEFLESLELRADREDFAVIVLSAHGRIQDIGHLAIVSSFLQKPFGLDDLIAIVRKHAR